MILSRRVEVLSVLLRDPPLPSRTRLAMISKLIAESEWLVAMGVF
jgi:hypothetical protein